MLAQGLLFVKTLIRSQLDIYVLPGTRTGTEILLLYMSQWKRDVVLFTTATRKLIRPEADRQAHTETSAEKQNGPPSQK